MTKTLLVALDINDDSGAAHVAQVASSMAASMGARLHAVNVIPGGGMSIVSSYLGADHSARMRKEARAELERFAAEHLPDLEGGDLHVEEGTIYDQILRCSEALGASMILIGAHRPELRDYLIGPNAARVARHAKTSVLVVRP